MPKDDRPPAMLLYFDDFVSDGKVEAMTTEQVGAYFLLLCKAWREDPPGSIPNDDRVLARWARLTPDDWSECRAGVLAAFSLGTDDRWHQKRMRKEFAKLTQKAKDKSLAAKRAANARWKHQQCRRTAGALPDDAISSSSSFATETTSPQTPAKPKQPTAGLAGGWEDIDSVASARLALRSAGYSRYDDLLSEMRAAGAAPEEIVAACQQYKVNASKFKGPGAIAEFLRSGVWPADGVVSVPQAMDRNGRKSSQQQEKVIESLRFKLIRGGRKEARDWGPDEILKAAKAGGLTA